jgi:hypothetical protein
LATSPAAIDRFLTAQPKTTIDIKEKSAAWCFDLIAKIANGAEPRFYSPPRLSQIQGLAFGLWAQRVLWYWDPRTGKTKLSLDWLSFLRATGKVERALIIAHAPIGIDEWESQYRLHSTLDVRFVRSGKTAWDELCDALESGADAVCTTWSTLQELFSEIRDVQRGAKIGSRKRYPDYAKLRATAEFFDCVIIDEIHKAMNDQALRFKIATELVQHCRWRAGLTGTPFGRNPFVLWAEAFLIDGGESLSTSRYFFEEAFGERKYHHWNRSGVQYVFPKPGTREHDRRMDILRGKLRHMMMSLALSEIQDTNVIANVTELTMLPKQRAAYRHAINGYIELKKGERESRVAIENIFLRLRQIASGFTDVTDPDTDQKHLLDLDCAKLDWLEETFADIGDEFKCVIFHDYTHSGERLMRLFKSLKIKAGWIYGGTPMGERRKLIDRFQEGDLPVIISNAATGGTAINLSRADWLVFYESPPGVISRKQAESRPLARGERPLVMDDLVCAPVEQRILDFAKEGRSLLDALVGDPDLIRGLRA